MTYWINGEKHDLHCSVLGEVIDHFHLNRKFVVAEVNGKIINREDWDEKKLEDGATIELIHFVGGG